MSHSFNCLICYRKIPSNIVEDECNPEVLNEVTWNFTKYLKSMELIGEEVPEIPNDLFPFCKSCSYVAKEVHELDRCIGTILARIRKIMLKVCATTISSFLQTDQSQNEVFVGREKSLASDLVESLRRSVFMRFNPSVVIYRCCSTSAKDSISTADVSESKELEKPHVEYSTASVSSNKTRPVAVSQDETKKLEIGTDYKDEPPRLQELGAICYTSDDVTGTSEGDQTNPANSHNSDYEMNTDASDEEEVEPRGSSKSAFKENTQSSADVPKPADPKLTRKEKQKQIASLLKQSETKPVSIRDVLEQVGPKKYMYLGKYEIDEVDKGHKCCTCGALRRRRADITFHIRMKHAAPFPHRQNIILTEKSPNLWYYGEFAAEKRGDAYHCSTCGCAYKGKAHIREHLRIRHFLLAHPEQAHLAPTFVCELCGSTFPTQGILNEHQYIHKEENSFKCTQCGEGFNTRKKLFNHRRFVHVGDEGKKILCDFCGKKFWDTNKLKQHLTVHTGQSNFQCEDCGKQYSCAFSLNVHRNHHTGERKHSCDICGKNFSQSGGVVRHKRLAHTVAQDRSRKRKRTSEEGDS